MPDTPDSTDKAAMRRQMRALRKAIGATQRKAAARALVRLALRYHLLGKGRRVGLYIPAGSEIDVLPLLERTLLIRAQCYLPVVPRRGGKRMWFSQMGDSPGWALNRYGIPEYRHPLAVQVRARRLDVLFMPLLGFDGRGYRLGLGGGSYDARLAYLGRLRPWRRPWVVGTAFSVQEVARVINDPWDIPLDAILTEREYRVFRPAREA